MKKVERHYLLIRKQKLMEEERDDQGARQPAQAQWKRQRESSRAPTTRIRVGSTTANRLGKDFRRVQRTAD
jgi:hypothetical protein